MGLVIITATASFGVGGITTWLASLGVKAAQLRAAVRKAAVCEHGVTGPCDTCAEWM